MRPDPPDHQSPPRLVGLSTALLHAPSVTTGGTISIGSKAEVVGFSCEPGEHEPPPFGGHLISLRWSAPQRVLWRTDGRTLEGVKETGHIAIVPAAKPFAFTIEKVSEEIGVMLKERFFGRVTEMAGANPDRLEVLDRFRERDEQVRRLVTSLVPEMEGEGLGGELYAEALVTQLAVHLLRYHSSLGHRSAQKVAREPTGPLSKPLISQALDYLNDNLSSKLSLEELAGVVGYSPHHFARLFKDATGHSPHRYVVRQRVEKARGLLTDTELPLANIARLCGFSGQSHMGKNVKAFTGSPPALLRKEARR